MPGWNKEIDKELSLDIILEEERERKNREIENFTEPETEDIQKENIEDEEQTQVPSEEIEIEKTEPIKIEPEEMKLPFDFKFSPKITVESKKEDLTGTKVLNVEAQEIKEKAESEVNYEIKRERVEDDKTKAVPQITQDINPLPGYNKNIDHKIIPPDRPVIHSAKMESDKYRTRFINRPVQNIEKTAEHEALFSQNGATMIEKPGMIKRKSQFSSTADLEPLPTIISTELMQVEDDSKTIVSKTLGKQHKKEVKKEEKEELEGQMKIMGFDEKGLEPDQIDEEFAEELVRISREEKVKKFVLDTDSETLDNMDAENPDDEDKIYENAQHVEKKKRKREKIKLREEYKVIEDKKKIVKLLSSEIRHNIASVCILSVIEIALIILSIFIKPEGAFIEVDTGVCLAINFVLMMIAFIVSHKTILGGLKGLIHFKPNTDTASSVTFLAGLVQNIVFFVCIDQMVNHANLLSAAAILVLLFNAVGKLIINLRVFGNFNFITNGTLLYGFETVKDEDDAFEIGRGLLIGEPDVRYSSKISFPMHFLSQSYRNDPADKFSGKLAAISLGLATVVGVAVAIISKNPIDTVTAFTGVCCICVPCASLIASNLPLFRADKFLNNHGGMISGHDAVSDSAEANAVIFDATDLYKRGGCNIHGIKMYNGMRIDESILYAAALVINSRGPLEDVFDKVVLGRKELLPELDSLVYEDKLGLSAWIHERRVLFGNRELLTNHNVEVPDQNLELKYTHDGRHIIYLAVSGKIAAMFVVSYNGDEFTAQRLQQIEKNDLTILVRTSDPNITEELISEEFGVPISGIKIMSAVAGKIYEGYRDQTIPRAEAKILHNGTNDMFLRTFCTALSLNNRRTLSTIIQIVGAAIGAVLVALISFMSGGSQIGLGALMIYQIFWAIIAVVIALVKKYK